MKNILILFAFVIVLGSNSFAQSGIQFNHDTWKEILAKAEKENKLIFMDAYAEWCGPCKKMSREVFTQKEVGDYFNAKFINVKMDMEKGEGPALAQQFGIRAYPTLLFISSTGEVVHQGIGYHTSDIFIELGEAALDPMRNVGSLKARYEKGDRDPELLHAYAMAKYDAMDPEYSEIAEAYMKTQKDWGSDENMDFLFQMVAEPGSKMFDYFVENRKKFEERYGSEALSGKVDQLVQGKIYEAESEADLKDVDQLYQKIYPEKAPQLSSRLRMGFHAQHEDWPNFATAAKRYYDKYPAETWEELNEIAWAFSEAVEGKDNTKTAINWAKKSISMDSNYYNNDTLASLYFKLGKKGKAKKAAMKAIELAKASGEDYSSTEELLEKIKGM